MEQCVRICQSFWWFRWSRSIWSRRRNISNLQKFYRLATKLKSSYFEIFCKPGLSWLTSLLNSLKRIIWKTEPQKSETSAGQDAWTATAHPSMVKHWAAQNCFTCLWIPSYNMGPHWIQIRWYKILYGSVHIIFVLISVKSKNTENMLNHFR